jgi:putative endonuclease
MKHFVYILCSERDGSYYKGYTLDPFIRLEAHNRGESEYTRGKLPWRLVFVQSFETKREALIRERVVKKYSRKQLEELINSDRNEIS